MKHLTILAVIVSTICSHAQADCRRARVCVQKVAVVHHQKQFIAPVYPVSYGYQVGAAIREEAIAERAARLALEKFAAALAEQQGLPGVGAPPDEKASKLAEVQAVFTSRCARCHSGAEPKGGLDLTDITKLSDLQAHKAEILARKGLMPPPDNGGAPIPDEEAALLEEWVLSR